MLREEAGAAGCWVLPELCCGAVLVPPHVRHVFCACLSAGSALPSMVPDEAAAALLPQLHAATLTNISGFNADSGLRVLDTPGTTMITLWNVLLNRISFSVRMEPLREPLNSDHNPKPSL